MIHDEKIVYLLFEQYIGEDASVFAVFSDQGEAEAALERYVEEMQSDEFRSDFYGIIQTKLLFDRSQLDNEEPYKGMQKQVLFDFMMLNAMDGLPFPKN